MNPITFDRMLACGRGSRRHLLVAVAVVLILAGCGKSGGGPTAPPAAVSVYVATLPSGAAVIADGNSTGAYTPSPVSVRPGGSLRLSLLGYADSTLIAPQQPETLRVSLRPLAGTPAHFVSIRLSPPPACPYGGQLAVGQDGKIYVPTLCGSSGTMSVYSAAGTLLSSWSTSGGGLVAGYGGLAVDSQGDAYVATWYGNNSSVSKYSSTGTLLHSLSFPGSGSAFSRCGVAIGSSDSVYVSAIGMVVIYGRDNMLSSRTVQIASYSTKFGTVTRDVQGNWYACSADSLLATSDAVFKVAPEGGSAVSSWQITLNGFGDVLGVGADARLYVYAFRTTGARVQRYSLDRQLLAEWTIKAPDAPGIVSGFAAALAPNGDVFELTGGTLARWSN